MGELVTVLNTAGGAFVAFAAHMLVQSSVLIILLAALDLVLRRRVKAVVRYWIWLLVLAKLLLPPSFSSPTGVAYWVGGKLPTLSGPIERFAVESSAPSLPAAAQRKVVDLQRIVFAAWWNVPIPAFSYRNATLTKGREKLEGQEVSFLSLQSRDGDTFGHHFISFTCELPAAGVYRVSLDAVKGPAQGQVQLFRDEAPVGPVVDLYAEQRQRVLGQDMGTLELAEGPNNLLFKIVGRNEKSQGQGGDPKRDESRLGTRLDVTNIICEKVD